MKLLRYFYFGLFFFAFSAEAARSSRLDRKLLMPTLIYPADSIVKHKPQSEAKVRIPGAISSTLAIVAVILVFAGATLGAIVFGALAIIMGLGGESVARKLTKNRQKSSPGSSEVKAAGAKFGMILGALAIATALIVGFYNAIMSWGG